MTHVLTPKPPADTVAYLIDWRQQLAADTAPDVIQSFSLVVTGGTVVIADSHNLGLAISADISGGADGETATLHCQITTYGGQTLSRDLSLLVSLQAVAVTPETTTKRTIIEMAFEECGMADYEFNTSNEEKASALRKLDALMALWAGPGFNLDLGYNFPAVIGQGNYSDPAGVPDSTLEAVSAHLAARIAPTIGKSLSPETKTALNRSLNALRAQYAVIPNRRLPRGTIVGAGQKPRSVWSPFFGVQQADGLGICRSEFAGVDDGGGGITVISQGGVAYTAQLRDNRSYILFTNNAPVSFTIPPQSAVAWEDSTTISFEQGGTGQVTVVAGAGVTVSYLPGLGLKTVGQHAVAQLVRTGVNTWSLFGAITA